MIRKFIFILVLVLSAGFSVQAQDPVGKLCAQRDINVRSLEKDMHPWEFTLLKGECIDRLPDGGRNGYGENYWLVSKDGVVYIIFRSAKVEKKDF